MGRNAAARAAALALALWPGAATAHPHVFIDVSLVIAFDEAGRIEAVSLAWAFDTFFSAALVRGLDANRDGIHSREELAPAASANIESLSFYGYFAGITVDGRDIGFGPARDYYLTYEDSIATLHFTLPTRVPIASAGTTTRVSLSDPEYYIAFAFSAAAPAIRLAGAPPSCAAYATPPLALQPELAARFAAVGPGQPLPPDLLAIASGIASVAEIRCP